MTVSNVEAFLSDPKTSTVLRKSLARAAGQAVSAVHVSYTVVRRLQGREAAEPRLRQLSVGSVRADYQIVVGSNSVAPLHIVEKNVQSKTFTELADIMNEEAKQAGANQHILSVDSVSVVSVVPTATTLPKSSTTTRYSNLEGGQRHAAFVAVPWPGQNEEDAGNIHVLFTDPVSLETVEGSYPATGMERFGFEISTALPGENLVVEEVTVSPSELPDDPRRRQVIEASCPNDELSSRLELVNTPDQHTRRLSMSSFRFLGTHHIFLFFKVRHCRGAGLARTGCREDCGNITDASTTLHAFRLALTPWSGGTVLDQTEQVVLLNRSSTSTWPGGIVETAIQVGGAGEVDVTAILSSASRSIADSLPDLVAEQDVQVINIWVQGLDSGRQLHVLPEQIGSGNKSQSRELASAPLIILRVLIGIPRPERRREVERRLHDLQHSQQHARTFEIAFEQYLVALGFEPEDMLVQVGGPDEATQTTSTMTTTRAQRSIAKTESHGAWWLPFAMIGGAVLLLVPSCLLTFWQWRHTRRRNPKVADAIDDDDHVNTSHASKRKRGGSRTPEFLSVFGPVVDHEKKAFDDL